MASAVSHRCSSDARRGSFSALLGLCQRPLEGVNTTSRPPSSSSYAGNMSATALARSAPALSSTGLPLTRTSHSRAVARWSTPSLEAQTERLLQRLADRGLGAQAGELERATAAIDDPSLRVAREERGGRRRVVIVEQLEQVGEPAFLASARFTPESGVTVGPHRTVAAMGADEVVLVRHVAPRIVSHLKQRMRRACQPTYAGWHLQSKPSCAAGGSRPKCSNARRVAARPRGVRSISPRWSR